MMQRTTIRGMYGISGDAANDCLISFFCQQCVLAQSDREVRAREGAQRLRNDSRYQSYKLLLETRQPPLRPPMGYLSPRAQTDTIPGNSQRGTYEMSLHSVPGSPTMSQIEQSSPSRPYKKTRLNSAHGSPAMKQTEQSSPSTASKKHEGNSSVTSFVSKLKKKRSSKLSSAHLSEGDEDGEVLLTPQESQAIDHQSLSRSSTVLRHSIIGAELHQRSSIGINKETQYQIPRMDFSRGLRDCDVFNVDSTRNQQVLDQSSPAEGSQTAAQRRRVSGDRGVGGFKASSENTNHSQHKPSHSGSVGSNDTVRQHPPKDPRRNTIPARKAVAQPEMAERSVSRKSSSIQKQTPSIYENTNGADFLQKISNFRQTHALTFCKDDSHKTVEEQQQDHSDGIKARSNGIDDNATPAQEKMTEPVPINETSPVISPTRTVSETPDATASQPQTSSSSQQREGSSSNVHEIRKFSQHSLAASLDSFPMPPLRNQSLDIGERTKQIQTSTNRQHTLQDCDPRSSLSTVAQHIMKDCVMETGPSSPARHSLAQDSVSSDSIVVAQHKINECVTKTGPPSPVRHSLAQDSISNVSTLVAQHQINECVTQTGPSSPARHSLSQDPRSSVTTVTTMAQHQISKCVTETAPSSPARHSLARDSINSVSTVAQHQITKCVTQTGPSSPARHSLSHDPRSSVSIVIQHKINQCVTGTGASTPERHGLLQCEGVNQITRSNTVVTHVLADCDVDNRKSIIQHSLAECDLLSGATTPARHSLGKCEDTNQVTVREFSSSHDLAADERVPYSTPDNHSKPSAARIKLVQTLSEGSSDPVGSRPRSAGGLMDRILGSRKASPRPVNPRLSSCPVPAAATSASPTPDVTTSNHLPEKAQIDNRSESVAPPSIPRGDGAQVFEESTPSAEGQNSTSSSGKISPKDKSRRGTKQSLVSQRETNQGDQLAQKSQKDQKYATSTNVSTPHPIPAVTRVSEPAAIPLPSTPQSDRSKWPSTVGPGFISEKDRARLDGRRTQSEWNYFSDDEEEENEQVSNAAVEEMGELMTPNTPGLGSGVTGFFSKFTGSKGS
jgi:hypothetical protein